MTKHPAESDLALYAGGDLGWWRTRIIVRHLTECAVCDAAAAEYSTLRSDFSALDTPPVLSWTNLAAEMRANIRLGLEAGECVLPRASGRPAVGLRAGLAFACLVLLAVASGWMHRSATTMAQPATDTVIVEATGAGIQVRQGAKVMSLLNKKQQDVINTISARGEMRARYVEADSSVTVNNVYVQ